MILERPKNFAELHLHFRGGLEMLEHDESTILEQRVELAAHVVIGQRLPIHTFHNRAERKIIPQIADLDTCHVALLIVLVARP